MSSTGASVLRQRQVRAAAQLAELAATLAPSLPRESAGQRSGTAVTGWCALGVRRCEAHRRAPGAVHATGDLQHAHRHHSAGRSGFSVWQQPQHEPAVGEQLPQHSQHGMERQGRGRDTDGQAALQRVSGQPALRLRPLEQLDRRQRGPAGPASQQLPVPRADSAGAVVRHRLRRRQPVLCALRLGARPQRLEARGRPHAGPEARLCCERRREGCRIRRLLQPYGKRGRKMYLCRALRGVGCSPGHCRAQW